MKLSEKGLTKLSIEDFEYDPQSVEFKPDDFTNCVVLTVEEARRIKNALWELLRNSNDKNANEWLIYWMVNGRIEQSEKENA